MASIYIFTGPIRSGKTTALMDVFGHRPDTFGFLSPDIQEIRHLYNLKTKEILPFQVKENPSDNITQIGKFVFLTDTFKKAQDILLDTNCDECNFFIIDEVGKLELKDNGLEPALSLFISHWKSIESDAKLVIVIRDYLLDEIISKYKLENEKIVKNLLVFDM